MLSTSWGASPNTNGTHRTRLTRGGHEAKGTHGTHIVGLKKLARYKLGCSASARPQRVMPSPINSDSLLGDQRFMYQVGQRRHGGPSYPSSSTSTSRSTSTPIFIHINLLLLLLVLIFWSWTSHWKQAGCYQANSKEWMICK